MDRMPEQTLAAFIYSCWRCFHFNYGRRFCEKCGSKLTDPEAN
jgi:rRNA maturation endonuclease Nob1